jgi:hypothetical protein
MLVLGDEGILENQYAVTAAVFYSSLALALYLEAVLSENQRETGTL